MAKEYSVPAIISDANILIDYLKTDRDMLRLLSHHLAPLYVADVVAAEVSQLKKHELSSLGITVIETPYSIFAESSDRSSSISLQDFVSMQIAKEKGWVCATNDKALRRECTKMDVTVLWGLELMLYLVKKGVLEHKRAKDTAWDIHQCNRTITESVVYSFIDRLVGL